MEGVSLPEKTNLYINSSHSISKDKIEISIPDGVLQVKPNEDLYLTVISLNTFYTFYQVIDGYNNQFNTYDNGVKSSFKLPIGNISVTDILNYFKSIENTSKIIVTYDKQQNKFHFLKQNQNHSAVLELVNCHSLLGFRITESQITITSHIIETSSSIPINVMSITNLYLHLDVGFDLSLNDNNLDNFNGIDNVKPNNIICSIPVNNCYNSIISYQNYDGGTAYQFKCNHQEILQSLSLSIKDQNDKLIPNFPDFNCIIQFQKRLKVNQQTSLLQIINDTVLRILFLLTELLRPRNR